MQEFEVGAILAHIFVNGGPIRIREHGLVLATAGEEDLLVHLLHRQFLEFGPAA